MAGEHAGLNGIRAVFFDAGDTLHRLTTSRTALVASLLVESGVRLTPSMHRALEEREAREIARVWDDCNLRYPDEEEGQRFLTAECALLLQRLGVDDVSMRAAQIARGIVRPTWRRLFPDVLPALGALRPRFRVGIISNAGSYMRHIYAQLGVLEQVEFLITSGEAGVEKPDPAIFALALKRASVQPDQAIHVGDNPTTDVAGARAAGITPVLLLRGDAASVARECPVVSSLTELLGLLGLPPYQAYELTTG